MKKTIINKWIFYSLIVLFSACNPPEKKPKKMVLYQATDYVFPYDLQKPEHIWKPSKKLHEISGLSYLLPYKIISIQDEKGYLYFLDAKTGKTIEKIKFGKDGDYEGVELVHQDAWVVKSNGDLYQVKNYMEPSKRKTIKHKTPLSKKNDVEGLAFDAIDSTLLIACKGYPFLDKRKNAKYFKAVYKFDLNTQKLIEKPYLLLALDSLKKFKNFSKSDELGIKLVSTINESEGDPTLQPSGIAIHPKTKNIYLLSSVGKTLLVIDHEGEIKAMIKLERKLHPQPEGICFAPDGTLYISNEGKKRKARVLSYSEKK